MGEVFLEFGKIGLVNVVLSWVRNDLVIEMKDQWGCQGIIYFSICSKGGSWQ